MHDTHVIFHQDVERLSTSSTDSMSGKSPTRRDKQKPIIMFTGYEDKQVGSSSYFIIRNIFCRGQVTNELLTNLLSKVFFFLHYFQDEKIVKDLGELAILIT
jgi:hypothetical protein